MCPLKDFPIRKDANMPLHTLKSDTRGIVSYINPAILPPNQPIIFIALLELKHALRGEVCHMKTQSYHRENMGSPSAVFYVVISAILKAKCRPLVYHACVQ